MTNVNSSFPVNLLPLCLAGPVDSRRGSSLSHESSLSSSMLRSSSQGTIHALTITKPGRCFKMYDGTMLKVLLSREVLESALVGRSVLGGAEADS